MPKSHQSVSVPVAPGLALEGVLHNPPAACGGAALVCHPHPGFGGTMDSHLVLAMCQALCQAGLAALRFNFRGVGGSDGKAAGGDEEPADVLAALEWLRRETGHQPHLVGYSFGAVMALAALAQGGSARSLCCVGFPAALASLTKHRLAAAREVTAGPAPVLFIAGEEDRFGDPAWMEENLAGAAATFQVLPGEDHFFVETADKLAERVASFIAGGFIYRER